MFVALRYGARAYFSSYSDAQTLLSAIEAGHQGRCLVSSEILRDPLLLRRGAHMARRQALAKRVLAAREDAAPPIIQASLPDGFGAQEREVLLLVARGKTNKEIATLTGLSDLGVKMCLTRIFSLLRVSGRTEAVVQAWRLGWISLEVEELEAALV